MAVRRVEPADAVLAAIAGFVLVMAALNMNPGDHRPFDALGWTAVAVAGASLLFRRACPLPVLVVVTAALLVYGVRDYAGGPIYGVGAIALYSYAVRVERRRAALTGLAVAIAVFVVRSVAVGGSWPITLVVFAWASVAVLAADAVRSAGERRRLAGERRDSELHRRLAEERLQIARDLHDSVAHAMTVINVQAGVAAHLLTREPGSAAPALDAIKNASRDVLVELAALLEVLRRDDVDRPAPRTPLPQLADLGALVDSSARAGLQVELRTAGDLSAVPAAVSTVAYRVIQEALTNVIRHAATDRAEVSVEVVDGALTLAVVDDGAGGVANTCGAGVGLTGISERAAGTGGTVAAGRRMEGGFAVRARWPAPRQPAVTSSPR